MPQRMAISIHRTAQPGFYIMALWHDSKKTADAPNVGTSAEKIRDGLVLLPAAASGAGIVGFGLRMTDDIAIQKQVMGFGHLQTA